MHKKLATLAQLANFDTIIDVRSPAEFLEDHLPDTQNCPVLDNEERIKVGTLYKQVSAFEARKVGAVLVARNIAKILENGFLERAKNWRPLIYCWRGGQRSGALTHVMREVGWDAHQLAGGYKTWRRHVLGQLEVLPSQFDFRVISGATGSGKSRLLESLAAQGAQVLHLEHLAAHKGSVLGGLPGQSQPAQRGFDTGLFTALAKLIADRPVYVEAESRKIGRLQLPETLVTALRRAPCLRMQVQLSARVDFLLEDYRYALKDTAWLATNIERLHGLHSRSTLARWQHFIEDGEFRQLVEELLTLHYDPQYLRSQKHNYVEHQAARVLNVDQLSQVALDALAQELMS